MLYLEYLIINLNFMTISRTTTVVLATMVNYEIITIITSNTMHNSVACIGFGKLMFNYLHHVAGSYKYAILSPCYEQLKFDTLLIKSF